MGNTFFPIISKEHLKLPIYLESIGTDFLETQIVRPEGYPVYQWIQCISGEGLFLYNNKEYPIKRGQGMFIYPNIPHEYYTIQKPWITNWIAFDGYSILSLLNILGITQTGVFDVTDTTLLEQSIRDCLSLCKKNTPLTTMEVSAYLYGFLIDLFKHTVSLDKDSKIVYYDKLQPVIDFIDTFYYEALSIEALSKIIHVTPQYLCTLFKKVMNKRPFEYINQVRVNKSKELMLSNHQFSIAIISKKVGFESPSYFGYIFKKGEGMTPGKFKQLYTSV